MAQHRFYFLLAALVFALVVSPLLEDTRFGAVIFTVGLTTVFLSGINANRERKWIYRIAIFVAALAIPVSWAAMFTKYAPLDLSQYLIVVLFCGVTAGLILIAVLRETMAPTQAVAGAICVYLLTGLLWAMIYTVIEYIDHEPFQFSTHRRTALVGVEHTSFAQLTYFSFVTMSTLGYGDIVPRSPLAETACWLQSVVGQLYIAILIARLVTELPVRRPPKTSGEG